MFTLNLPWNLMIVQSMVIFYGSVIDFDQNSMPSYRIIDE